MAVAEAAKNVTSFSGNADFIAFDPPSPSEAGPSKRRSAPEAAAISAGGQSKKKRKSEGAQEGSAGKKAKKKGKGKAVDSSPQANPKGKGKANGTANGVGVSGAPTGPRNLKEERRAAERGCPWVDLVDWTNYTDPAEMLNAEIHAFHRYMSPSRAEYEVRLFIIEIISRKVKETWPEAEVHPFGSWVTQMYLPSGDIDLVVTTNRLTVSNKAKLLAELARAMRSAYLTDVVAIISKARVPIIKFVTTQGSLNVDISLNQTNGINAGMIINQYLDILPAARQLILVVKAFLSQRSMNEVYTGGLGSYAVICLVISFLQVHPKLRRSEIDPSQNLGTLLIEFFELYGRNFNYEDVGLSIRRGGFYYSKRSRGWYKAMQPYALSIEDPQDKDNDISSGSYGIRQVRATLAGAFDMLRGGLFDRAKVLAAQGGVFDETFDPADMSILSDIMGVTKETLKHRHELMKLHQEGILQRMLEIPIGVDPLEYLSGSRSYVPLLPPPPELPSHPRNHQRDDQNFSAIIVNDDEIDLGDLDSDGEDDFEEYGMEDAGDTTVVIPQTKAQRSDRFASVSVDSMEEAEVNGPRAGPSDGESRYAMEGRGTKRKQPAQASQTPIEVDDSDDDSVVAIDPPPGTRLRKVVQSRAAKKDFWAGKGRVEADLDSGEA